MPPKPAPAAKAKQASLLKSPLPWTLLVLALALLFPLSTYILTPSRPADAIIPHAPAPPAAAAPSMAAPPPAAGASEEAAAPEAEVPHSTFTKASLAHFKGVESASNPSGLIYLAILGRVYDVTSGRRFYGAGGAYNTFAGRDATPALAKNRVLKPEGEEVEAVGEEGWRGVLTEGEWESVGRWEGGLSKKYKVVGVLV